MTGGGRLPRRDSWRVRTRRARLRHVTLLAAAIGLVQPGDTAAQVGAIAAPPVEVGPPPAVRLPAIRRFELENGLPVRLVEMHAVPIVQVNLLVRSGAGGEDPEKAGVADFTADLLDEGTEERGALELAQALEELGATLATGAGWDASFAGLHVPAARLEPALELMAEVVRRPAFPEEELRRKRLQRLTAFLQARDVPALLASTAMAAQLYPATHRYHARTGGTAATVERLEREDLLRFYRTRWAPSNAALVVTGDVTEERLRPLLERFFGDWAGAAAEPRGLPEAPQVAGPRIVLVDRPGSEQSEIRLARLGPPRSTEEYVKLVVLNALFGGSFTSRLNQNLREQHGWTYGAGSGFDFRAGPGPVVAGAAVQTAATDSALVEFLRELRRIRDETPPADEVEKAKRYVALSFPAEFETTGNVAGKVGELVIYGLPGDFWDRFVERVGAVVPADLQEAARRWYDPDASLLVVVGDAAVVRPGLERLGLAPVEVQSIERVMGPAPRLEGEAEEGP